MADQRVYIEWNIVNWITIVLMVGLGYALVGAVTQGLKMAKPTQQGS